MNNKTSMLLASLLLTTGLMAEQRTDVLDQAGSAPGVAAVADASKLDKAAKKDAAGEKTAEEIAAELRNPATPMSTMVTKWEYRTYEGSLPGANDQTGKSMLFQPAFPIPLGEGKVFAFRPAVPIFFDTPYFDGNSGQYESSTTTIGDIGFDMMVGKSFESGLIALGGMVGTLPWASDDHVSANQYRLGGEAMVGYMQSWGFVGALVSHQWDVGGYGSNKEDYSTTAINYIYAFSLGDGWQVSSGPIATCNWEAESGNRWSVPVGVGIYKTVKMGGMPWKLGFEVQKFVVKTDEFNPDWYFQVVIAPVVKNPFAGLFQ